jgi:phosphomannomutase
MKQGAIQRAGSGQTNHLGRYSIQKKETLDGIKFFLDASTEGNGAVPWVLFRMSGTEPLLRVYCEAASPGLVEEILSLAEAFVRDAGS